LSKTGSYYNEIDPFAAAWLRELIKAGLIADGEVDERSIELVQPDDLRGFVQCHFFAGIGGWSYALRLAGWPDDRAVWTGSCPCQPFSMAGAGAGTSDSRHLWPMWYRLIAERRPTTVFGEQVSSTDGLYWLDLVYVDLEATGYALGAVDCCAAGLGAFHIRQRLYFVADAESGRAERLSAEGPVSVPDHPRRGEVGDMADTMRKRGSARTADVRWQTRGNDSGSDIRMGHANNARPQGRNRAELPERAGQQSTRSTSDAYFWDAIEWLSCRDGKTRPVEPGTFPLAHGIPARVGRLRGYGNAIIPQVAAAFIESYLDVTG
jgi:DNA (cytosine-5)-methyltransferase 1